MTLELIDDNEVYGDHNSLRIEDLENRRKWKIVVYTDSRDGRKTRTHSSLREAIAKAPSVTKFPRLLSDIVDYVFIKDVSKGNSLTGEEISIEEIVSLLEKKGIGKDVIKKVDENLAKTFTDYKRKLE